MEPLTDVKFDSPCSPNGQPFDPGEPQYLAKKERFDKPLGVVLFESLVKPESSSKFRSKGCKTIMLISNHLFNNLE
jgi:hypothetical protein